MITTFSHVTMPLQYPADISTFLLVVSLSFWVFHILSFMTIANKKLQILHYKSIKTRFTKLEANHLYFVSINEKTQFNTMKLICCLPLYHHDKQWNIIISTLQDNFILRRNDQPFKYLEVCIILVYFGYLFYLKDMSSGKD